MLRQAYDLGAYKVAVFMQWGRGSFPNGDKIREFREGSNREMTTWFCSMAWQYTRQKLTSRYERNSKIIEGKSYFIL
jgi:hypothetical protein